MIGEVKLVGYVHRRLAPPEPGDVPRWRLPVGEDVLHGPTQPLTHHNEVMRAGYRVAMRLQHDASVAVWGGFSPGHGAGIPRRVSAARSNAFCCSSHATLLGSDASRVMPAFVPHP